MIGKEEKIIAGAREIFRVQGIKALTMDEIAKRLHVSKKTLYVFFRNREMLLKRCIEDYIQEDIVAVDQIIADAQDAIDAFCSISYNRTQTLRGMSPKYYAELAKHYPAQLKQLDDHNWKNLLQRFIEIVEKGIEGGLFIKGLDAELVARLYLKKGLSIMDKNYFPAEKYETIDVFLTDLELFIRGLATEKGLTLLQKHKCHLETKMAELA